MIKATELLELKCNVDDMTGEAVGFALERFFEAGALDAYVVSIIMKKSRPGFLICITCAESERETMLSCIFKHTTTIGVRETRVLGYAMARRIDKVDTNYGPVRLKTSHGYGAKRQKYEYSDISRIANENKCSLATVIKNIVQEK